ncbi:MAG: hypothetical protein EPN69_04655 [Rhodanobacter sp.]|nr:MAG: hypothetical protein EPN69_04655 [Rhodanobacter sp.]TAM00491.1 MAG: hypothetical protein EPN71_06575 [Rhodanobacter sp.]TAM39492.1 MAG: hypothetical protein EPN58_13495 [Rhodanobacter sp.]TAN29064.1 MAG: hypothetical protein EPN32_01565 [Rhodanobacter sp.]
MRTFDDAQGGHWQVALMEGSYGSVELIFGRIGGDQVLHRALDAEVANLGAATELITQLDDADLCAYLAEATPWK